MESTRNFSPHTSTGEPGLGSLAERSRPAGGFQAVCPPHSAEHSGGRSRWIVLFHETPCWLLLVALIYAPWAYGSTRSGTIEILHWQLGLILIWWALSCLVQRRWPRIHPVLIAVVGLLLFQGWWMTLNAKFVFDDKLQYTAIESLVDWAPGSVNRVVSWPNIVNLSLMLGVAYVACDLAQRSAWRKRLWLVMALTGLSLIVFGLAQKLTHAPGIFWKDEKFGPTFFGAYRYHANAGAFMNIIWPLVAAWLMLALRKPRAVGEKILWCIALAVCLVGVFANTSRASSFIALIMLLGWGAWNLIRAVRGQLGTAESARLVGVALVSATLLALVIGFGGLDTAWKRWSAVDKQFSANNPRLLVAQVCVDMLPHSGWFGFGPGTFRAAFPFYNKHTGPETRGVWLYAHQDYLQTLVEWGWIGAVAFAVTALGGLGCAVWLVTRHRRQIPARDRYLCWATAAGLCAVLVHALGDFPLQVPSIQLYFATLIGMLWSVRQWSQ